jgi:hypothetical protein
MDGRVARMLERKRSYQQACGSETTALFMADLARFCRADRPCFDPDPRVHALLEGRREVWLRIQEHLNWTPEMLVEVYGRTKLVNDGDEDD